MYKKTWITIVLSAAVALTGCGFGKETSKITETESQVEEASEIISTEDIISEVETDTQVLNETYDEKILALASNAAYGEYYEIDSDYFIQNISECSFYYETGETALGEDYAKIYLYDLGVIVWFCYGSYKVETIEEDIMQAASASFINSLIDMNGEQIFANDPRYKELVTYAINYNNVMGNMGAASVFYHESYDEVMAEYTLEGFTIWFYVYKGWAMVQISN